MVKPRATPYLLSLIVVAWTTLAAPPALAQSPAHWTVDSVPAVDIGTASGPEPYALVNPLSAVVLSDGSIVVENAFRDLFEIRFFDAKGQYRTTVGRWGQGPYEFRTCLGMLRLGGDSVLAIDIDGRYGVWGPEGQRVRNGRLSFTGTSTDPVVIDRGHVALVQSLSKGRPNTGVGRSQATVVVYDLETGHNESVASILQRAQYVEPIGQGWTMYSTPFGPTTYVVGGAGLVWIGDTSSDQIRAYQPGVKGPVASIKPSFGATRVTSADRRRMREAFAATSPNDKRWTDYVGSMDFPDRMPYFGALQVDRLGNLWVEEYEVPWATGPQHWEVYAPAGARIAEVTVPTAALIECSRRARGVCATNGGWYDLGDDFVLVGRRDADDVPHVQRFAIHKRD